MRFLTKSLSLFKLRHVLDISSIAILYFFAYQYAVENVFFGSDVSFRFDFNPVWNLLLLLPGFRFLVCPMVRFYYNRANANPIFLHVGRNVVTLRLLDGNHKPLSYWGNYSAGATLVCNVDELLVTLAEAIGDAGSRMMLFGVRPYILFTTSSPVTSIELEAITVALYDVGAIEVRSMPAGAKVEDAKSYVRNHPVRSPFVNWVTN
jgi:hypothetical protein